MLKRKRDMEIIKISATIVTLYTLLTLPNQIASISGMVFQNYELSILIFKFSTHLHLLHNCCNPFVYGMISRGFRSRMTKAACNITNAIFRRKLVRSEKVHSKELGYTNIYLDELDINSIVLKSVKNNSET